MRALFLTLVLVAPMEAQTTRPERTRATETSTYADVIGFVDSLARASADLRVGTLGVSPEGRRIPYVIAARPMVDGPGDAHRSGKPIFYIQGNIHAGEVEGKEAAQMLLRDLALGPLRPLLDSVIVIVVPIYNADGNERFGPGEQNRPGQNGPEWVGQNLNGQGLNLNRDYVKLEAPETQAALALLDRWEPDGFIDLHTTNGSYHGYVLTYATGLNPNSPPVNDYIRDGFLPRVRERMRRRHRQETFWYGNFRNQEPDSLAQGWETYDPRPRFGTNNMAMQGKIAILSEGYSNAPFGERISATYNFVHEILSLAAEERAALTLIVARSAAWRPDSVVLRSVLAPATVQPVIAELTQPDGDGSGGFARRRRSGVYKTIRMPVFDRFAPALQVARPRGYLLPAAYRELAGHLRHEGVIVFRVSSPDTVAGEVFTVDSVIAASAVFEGHRTITLSGRWSAEKVPLAVGGFYVPTDQRLGVLAAYLLEPMSEDGFVTWNFLDRDLRVGERYPIARIGDAPRATLELEP